MAALLCQSIGRHQKRTNCTQRALLIPLVEERVEDHVETQRLAPGLRDQIEAMLRDELSSLRDTSESQNRRLRTQHEQLTNERTRLLQAHYAGAVPLDLLKAEQDRIMRRIADIEAKLDATNVEFDDLEMYLQKALDYAMNCGAAYLRASPQGAQANKPSAIHQYRSHRG